LPEKHTIKDVARVAGVSIGTVSNVLNRPGQVSPGYRARVEAAITELGFVRDETAWSLRSRSGAARPSAAPRPNSPEERSADPGSYSTGTTSVR